MDMLKIENNTIDKFAFAMYTCNGFSFYDIGC